MSEPRRPVDELLDQFLFAPIGLLTAGKDKVPALAEQGRQQLALYKVIGQFAVAKARQELEKRFAQPGAPSASTSSESAPGDTPVPVGDNEIDISVRVEPAVLAIDGYDSLAASQIVGRLAQLTGDDLDAIERHERAHRNRKTVLGKIDQLRSQ